MKKLKLLCLAGSLSLAVAGAGTIGAAFSAKKAAEPVKAGATAQTFSCKVMKNEAIASLPTTMYAYAWNAGTDPVESLTSQMYRSEDSTSDFALFDVSLPVAYDSVLFKTEQGWLGTQTVDLSATYKTAVESAGYSTMFVVSAFNGDHKWTGDWEVSSPEPTFTSSYLRMWLDPTAVSAYSYGHAWTIHYWKDDGTVDAEIPLDSWINIAASGDRYVVYADVPTAIVGCFYQIKIYNDIGTYADAATNKDDLGADQVYATGDNAELYYLSGSAGSLVLSKGIAAKDSAEQTIAVAALEQVMTGYFSCAASADNGYGNFRTLVTTWIHNFEDPQKWWISGDMTSVTMNDFSGSGTDLYGSGLPRETTVTVQAKYDEMSSLYANANPESSVFLNATERSAVVLPTVLVAGGALLVGLFFLLRKRKANLA
jgi:hypothetical protein